VPGDAQAYPPRPTCHQCQRFLIHIVTSLLKTRAL